ncbi:MAG TPA: VOC family protein [Gemmatimonadales bacterium]|nr:VOC family protein [Gemmatimonadales bacterium]
MAIPIRRLNHAVLFVRDLDRAVNFYREAFGFEEIAREGGRLSVRRSPLAENHHDLGLMEVGANAPSPPPGATGLYHLAWQLDSIDDLAAAEAVLANLGALTGRSDHGATKSLYGPDPDGNEFEVMWMVPHEEWGEYDRRAVVQPLNMQREVARFGSER